MSKRSNPRKCGPNDAIFSLNDLESAVGLLSGGIAVLEDYSQGHEDALAYLAGQLANHMNALRAIIYRKELVG